MSRWALLVVVGVAAAGYGLYDTHLLRTTAGSHAIRPIGDAVYVVMGSPVFLASVFLPAVLITACSTGVSASRPDVLVRAGSRRAVVRRFGATDGIGWSVSLVAVMTVGIVMAWVWEAAVAEPRIVQDAGASAGLATRALGGLILGAIVVRTAVLSVGSIGSAPLMLSSAVLGWMLVQVAVLGIVPLPWWLRPDRLLSIGAGFDGADPVALHVLIAALAVAASVGGAAAIDSRVSGAR